MKKPSNLTIERLMQLVDYNKETGKMVWKIAPSNRTRVGSSVGSVGANGRLYLSIDNERHIAHHVAWFYVHGAWPKENLIAKNGDYADLRIDNFEERTASQTARSGGARTRPGSTGYKGVSFDKSKGLYVAYITRDYKMKFLGRYKTPEEAHDAYIKAAVEYGVVEPVDSHEEIEARAAAVKIRSRQRYLWKRLDTTYVGFNAWSDIEDFIDSIGDEIPDDHEVVSLDTSQPIGPGNFKFSPIVRNNDWDSFEGRKNYRIRHRAAHPIKHKEYDLKNKFGLTYTDYKSKLDAQGGVCAICGGKETVVRDGKVLELAVDHCHDSGKVRDLLCRGCNQMIGNARENIEIMKKGIAYLERHKDEAAP